MKPDWDDAPEWANYLAANKGEQWCWYENDPEYDDVSGEWIQDGLWMAVNLIPMWKDSKETRPEEAFNIEVALATYAEMIEGRAMKPQSKFSLARMLAGDPVVTRTGKRVTCLGHHPDFPTGPYISGSVEDGDCIVEAWTEEGKRIPSFMPSHPLDLMMAYVLKPEIDNWPDRELSSLAAKAIGDTTFSWFFMDEEYYGSIPLSWNPLHDDGDALRLAVKLNLAIILTGVAVNVSEIGGRSSIEPTGDDPCAATRRAIVRAAAEIGRGME